MIQSSPSFTDRRCWPTKHLSSFEDHKYLSLLHFWAFSFHLKIPFWSLCNLSLCSFPHDQPVLETSSQVTPTTPIPAWVIMWLLLHGQENNSTRTSAFTVYSLLLPKKTVNVSPKWRRTLPFSESLCSKTVTWCWWGNATSMCHWPHQQLHHKPLALTNTGAMFKPWNAQTSLELLCQPLEEDWEQYWSYLSHFPGKHSSSGHP